MTVLRANGMWQLKKISQVHIFTAGSSRKYMTWKLCLMPVGPRSTRVDVVCVPPQASILRTTGSYRQIARRPCHQMEGDSIAALQIIPSTYPKSNTITYT